MLLPSILASSCGCLSNVEVDNAVLDVLALGLVHASRAIDLFVG